MADVQGSLHSDLWMEHGSHTPIKHYNIPTQYKKHRFS